MPLGVSGKVVAGWGSGRALALCPLCPEQSTHARRGSTIRRAREHACVKASRAAVCETWRGERGASAGARAHGPHVLVVWVLAGPCARRALSSVAVPHTRQAAVKGEAIVATPV